MSKSRRLENSTNIILDHQVCGFGEATSLRPLIDLVGFLQMSYIRCLLGMNMCHHFLLFRLPRSLCSSSPLLFASKCTPLARVKQTARHRNRYVMSSSLSLNSSGDLLSHISGLMSDSSSRFTSISATRLSSSGSMPSASPSLVRGISGGQSRH
jgi:hypothetical protein